ncbi:MAG: VWA domain-containing protein [Akkermansiaceae bacterium]|nr:VWA domain-containing protein [Akkermansiaceae bacterium]
MSLHAQLTPEAQARLNAQRRNSTISSIVIAMLSVVLIGVLLMLFLLPVVDSFAPEIVSYQAPAEEEQKQEQREMTRQVQPKPSSPSSAMAKVIAANTVSNIAIPVPDTNADLSVDLGNGDDFGDGWGDGDGWGSGGGGSTTFFGQKVTAQRVVYVIDYSASMKGQRIKLLKAELAKSINRMAAGTEYQLIFFAGPAWLAGDKVTLAKDKSSATVVSDDTDYKWTCATKKAHDWDTQGRKQSADWLEASQEQLNKSAEAIKNTQLVWGTAWKAPLEMALDMKPTPDVIFFMTDGLAGGDSEAVARSIGARAKSRKIQLNTIAMMDPKAAEAMRMLAEASGGQFSMVNADGKVVKNIPKGNAPPKKKAKKNPKKKGKN